MQLEPFRVYVQLAAAWMAWMGTTGAWLDDWAWGLVLVAVSLVIHAVGLALIGALLVKWFGGGTAAKRTSSSLFRFASVIAMVSLTLAILHGVEAGVWMAAYLALGASDTVHDAILISLQMVTTLGPTDAHLHSGWRLMGPLEGIAGMLAFGLSTAFLIAVFQRVSPFASAGADRLPR
ncbi:MAG: hypothetical protein U1E70_07735 [Acetobacteraceae bacterium]